jgi:hypothetical protein
VLDLIELHDDAYAAWRRDTRRRLAAEADARRLIDRLGPEIGLYLRFHQADNASGDKDRRQVAWFTQMVESTRGNSCNA